MSACSKTLIDDLAPNVMQHVSRARCQPYWPPITDKKECRLTPRFVVCHTIVSQIKHCTVSHADQSLQNHVLRKGINKGYRGRGAERVTMKRAYLDSDLCSLLLCSAHQVALLIVEGRHGLRGGAHPVAARLEQLLSNLLSHLCLLPCRCIHFVKLQQRTDCQRVVRGSIAVSDLSRK